MILCFLPKDVKWYLILDLRFLQKSIQFPK